MTSFDSFAYIFLLAATAAKESKEKPSVKTDAPVAPTDGTVETTPLSTTKDKSTKRGSVFGGLFNKKDTPKAPTESTTAPATTPAVTSTKDEPTAVSSTAPQLENPVTAPTPAPDSGKAEAAAASNGDPAAIAAAIAASSTTADSISAKTPTSNADKRRTSFFGGIGSKKEKKSGATSGDELTDGENKEKSGGFGHLLRKASRATKPKPSTSGAPAVPSTKTAEPTEVPLPKETPAEIPLPKETPAEPEALANGEATTSNAVTGGSDPATTLEKAPEATKTVEATA